MHAYGAAATDTPRLASSSVQTDPTAQSLLDLVRTSVFLFTLIVLFSEEFLLHSSGHAVLVRSFSYTPRAGFSEEFLLLS